MRVVGKNRLEAFARKHADAANSARALVHELENNEFKTPHDLEAHYPKAKFIDGNTVVFRIRHNRFRMTTKVDYTTGTILIIAVEPHAEYDRRQY